MCKKAVCSLILLLLNQGWILAAETVTEYRVRVTEVISGWTQEVPFDVQ
ncbi:MAG: hypothetical protein NTY19_19995 [Planctomycetota bacterium]|nr:hypothetical protein [Planctomycetota bacterium]